MCGIFFSIGFENLPSSVIDSVIHRGPDGRGWNEFTSPQGPIVMAHRRLAIVDLSEDGHQPMSSEDGRYWITYNGEIYNFLELRKDLEELGHSFKTKTDTEVLLKSYLQWGEGCLHKFNGMFAFVIWDDSKKVAFAARDRFGVKPLYYYRQGSKIAFASEIKQFKSLKGWKSQLNEEMIAFYKTYKYCDHRRETLYQNVFQLLPGSLLNVDNDLTLNYQIWYNLSQQIHPLTISDAEAIEQFRTLFQNAICLRLRSDVDVGACLSGGLDSTSIVSLMCELKKDTRSIKCFSAVFPGQSVDESFYINELAAKKGFDSYKNQPCFEDFLDHLDSILYHQDLPFAGTSIFAQWLTFQSAKHHRVKVLLDGQGADESLVGYPGMLSGSLLDYVKEGSFLKVINFLNWQKIHNHMSYKNSILMMIQHRLPGLYKRLLYLKGVNFNNQNNDFSSITNVCLYHFSHELPSLLRYEDRNSMASSCESRLPFLDYRLVEFILSISLNQRFRDTQTKWILRQSMKDINIASVINRNDKIGFATPEKEWSYQLKSPYSNFFDLILDKWIKKENF